MTGRAQYGMGGWTFRDSDVNEADVSDSDVDKAGVSDTLGTSHFAMKRQRSNTQTDGTATRSRPNFALFAQMMI